MTDLQEAMGQSGVTYHCRCGASHRVTEPRLIDAPGWSLTYEVVTTPAGSKKMPNGRKKAIPASTRSVPIFLCGECTKGARSKAALRRAR